MPQFIVRDVKKAPHRWGPNVEHMSPDIPSEQENGVLTWVSLLPKSPEPSWSLSFQLLESQLRCAPSRLEDSAAPQRLVAPEKASSVDLFLGHCSPLRGQRGDPQPSGVSSARGGLQASLAWTPIIIASHSHSHSHFNRTQACSLGPGWVPSQVHWHRASFSTSNLCKGQADGPIFSSWWVYLRGLIAFFCF